MSDVMSTDAFGFSPRFFLRRLSDISGAPSLELARDASDELVREALVAVRDAGMAMEISIAGTRKPCREIYPGPRILRLARELGLSISFASDSHATEHVAWNFDELARYAAAEGWTESVYFTREGMKSLPFLD